MASHLADKASKGRARRLVWIVPAVLLTLILLAYLGGVAFFNLYFMPGTVLDGQDVSLRSAAEVAQEKSESLGSYQTHVTGQGIDLTLTASDVSLAYDGDAYAREAVDQTNPWAWPVQLAGGTHDVSASSSVVFDQQALLALIDPFVKQAAQTAAKLGGGVISYDKERGSFTLNQSITAQYLDKDKVAEAIARGFAAQEKEITLGDDVLGSTDDAAHAALDAANAYLGAAGSTLTLDGETAAEVTADDIAGWVKVADDLTVSLDSDAVTSWVSEHVKRLNTVGSERSYTRPDGKKVKVSGGRYGWKVSEGDAASALVEAVEAGSPQAVEIPFDQRGNTMPDSSGRDWGKRYVDIDLTEQHVRMYDDSGKLVWESDCVTGDTSQGYDTPTGVYQINGNMSRNATLIGPDYDHDGESDYETKVSYWMPFIDNMYALHDSPRSVFGGNIYQWGGSHGCVNLPLSKAKALYGIVKVDDVVVVHW